MEQRIVRYVRMAAALLALVGIVAIAPRDARAAAADVTPYVSTYGTRIDAGVVFSGGSPCCYGESQPVPDGWSSYTRAATASGHNRDTVHYEGEPEYGNDYTGSASIDATAELTLTPAGTVQRLVHRGTASATATVTPVGDAPPGTATASAGSSLNVRFTLTERSRFEITGWQLGTGLTLCRRLTRGCPAVTNLDPYGLSTPNPTTGTLDAGTYVLTGSAGATTQTTNPQLPSSLGWNVVLTIQSLNVPVAWRWYTDPRYGDDADGDGRIDSYPPDGVEGGPLDATPSSFPVHFDADQCPSDGFGRRWRVEGVAVGGSRCSLDHSFPAEGSYDVVYEAFDPATGDIIAAQYGTVTVNDILIVSLGDSVASGEGAPETSAGVARWQDDQCHRSAAAGPAVAARLVEAASDQSTVTFVHLACSGATIDQGLLGYYAGIGPGVPVPPQVDAMTAIVGDREIDVLTVSVGANDVGFKGLVIRCYTMTNCDQPGLLSARDAFDTALPALGPAYDRLAAALIARGVDPSRVRLTEYFDPVRDDTGAPCDDQILEEAVNAPLLGITGAEAQWASEHMLALLNGEGAAAAIRNGWTHVTGIAGDFRPHGYCAAGHWVTQLTESAAQQQDINGTLHPNRAGHAESYGPRIRATIAA